MENVCRNVTLNLKESRCQPTQLCRQYCRSQQLLSSQMKESIYDRRLSYWVLDGTITLEIITQQGFVKIHTQQHNMVSWYSGRPRLHMDTL